MDRFYKFYVCFFSTWLVLLFSWMTIQADLGFSQQKFSRSKMKQKKFVIGVRAYLDAKHAMEKWKMTAKYLSSKFQDKTFSIRPVERFDEMDQLVAGSKIDFFITQPVEFIQIQEKYGASHLNSLQNSRVQNKGTTRFSSIFITRESGKEETIYDYKGKKLGALHPLAFGAFLMGKKHLYDQGISVENFFSDVVQFSNQNEIIRAVQDGRVDLGMIRTGILKEIGDQPVLNTNPNLRILEPKKTKGFPYFHTTALYPEYIFGSLKHVDSELAKQLSIALLQMHANNKAAISGDYIGWTIPLDIFSVRELMKELQVGVFSKRYDFSLTSFIKGNMERISFIVLIFLILLFLQFRIQRLYGEVKKKNREFEKLNARLRKETKKAIDYGIKVQKLAETGGNMAQTFHDILNPLSIIKISSETIQLKFKEEWLVKRLKKIDRAVAKISEIAITTVDSASQTYQSKMIQVEIWPIILEELGTIVQTLDEKNLNVTIKTEGEEEKFTLAVLPIHLTQICTNLINNAIEAMIVAGTRDPYVLVSCTKPDPHVFMLKIKDNGPGISDEIQKKIFEPSFSTKKEKGVLGGGHGIGLTSVQTILSLYQAKIFVESKKGAGTTFVITFYTNSNQESLQESA